MFLVFPPEKAGTTIQQALPRRQAHPIGTERAKTEVHFSIEVSFFRISLSGILKNVFLCVLCDFAVKSFLDKCDMEKRKEKGVELDNDNKNAH